METALIQSWARMPGAALAEVASVGSGWLFDWFGRQGGGSLAMFGAGFVLMLFNLVQLRRCPSANADRTQFLLYVPLVSALVFWFLTAPDVRFLGAVLALFFLLSVYLAAGSVRATAVGLHEGNDVSSQRVAVAVLVMALLGSAKFVGLGSLSWSGWTPLPVVDTVEMQTGTGALVLVPRSGNQCWNAPIPCASLFNPELRRGTIFSHSLFLTVKPD